MLEAHGDLEISFGSSRGRLIADGRRLVLDVDDPSMLARVVGRRSLRLLAAELARAGCTLHVRSGGRLLLVAGREADTGTLSRLCRLPRVELDPWFAVRSALRSVATRP